jgi:hypothetical protein
MMVAKLAPLKLLYYFRLFFLSLTTDSHQNYLQEYFDILFENNMSQKILTQGVPIALSFCHSMAAAA